MIPSPRKRAIPSLEVSGDIVKLSRKDFGQLLRLAMSEVNVDPEWYCNAYPDIGAALKKGKLQAASDHYFSNGYLEGRLPVRPLVEESFYKTTYPDVATAVRDRKFSSCEEHFIKCGYAEGRFPNKTEFDNGRRPSDLPKRSAVSSVAGLFQNRLKGR